MAWGGDTLFRRIADREDRDEVVALHDGEQLLEFRRVELANPRCAQTFVVDGEHDMRRDDGGIHIGKVQIVVRAHPRLVCLAANDEKDACTEGVACRLGELCTRVGAFDGPDLERLFVDCRRSETCRLKNAVHGFVWDFPVGKGTAGKAFADEFVKFHGDPPFHR